MQLQSNTAVMDKIQDPVVSANLPHKLLTFFGIIWVSFLLLAIFAVSKTFDLFGYTFSVVILAYPVTYIFNDIFTEIYGYRVSRKIVWSGFLSVLLVTGVAYLYTLVPPSEFSSIEQVKSFNMVFGDSFFVAIITIFGFVCGEFVNSYTIANFKIYTNGYFQEFRFIASTFFGQIIDNTVAVLAMTYLLNLFESSISIELIFTSVIMATVIEVIMLPVTKSIVKYVKEKEGIDTYDRGTNFNPLRF